MKTKFTLLSFLLLISLCVFAQTTRYVKPTATGIGDGSSWANASGNLQAMINASATNDKIWVAAGIYKPHISDRSISFIMKNGVAIYGGFVGTETLLNQRNWTTNPTILSGDLMGNDVITGSGATLSITNNTENSYHVIFNDNNGVSNSSILDGFTITGGNANGGTAPYYSGGGMYNNNSSPNLSNIIFLGNSAANFGGGIYNLNTSPTMNNVTFSKNETSNLGGGMYIFGYSPSLTNVNFSGNRAGFNGGGMYGSNSAPILNYITFSGNSAGDSGGGMYTNAQNSITFLRNVIFLENQAKFGGGMYYTGPYVTLINSTFKGNSATNMGGGMFNQSCPLSLLYNVAFSGNSASEGGGMANASSSPSLNNITFSGNSATNKGGGIYNSSSSTSIKNNIFWGNTKAGSVASAGADIESVNSSTTTVNYTSLQLLGSNYTTGFTLGSGNFFAQNPLFVNTADPDGVDNIFMTADDGLALLPCSHAINVGDNTDVGGSDITGSSRVYNNGIVDLGAYELQSVPPTRLYVNASATGANTGLSWANAFTDLQSALNYTCLVNITEIWVAAGTYKPHASDRNVSFTMKNGVAIYGGFVGTETLLNQRNWTTNPTILSGDLMGNDVITGSGATLSITNNTENSYHVIFNDNNGLNNTAILDGFTVSGGHANGATSPNNSGGGIYNNSASPNLSNVTFSANKASNGGGMYNINSSPSLNNITFSVNRGLIGGGIYNQNSSQSLNNITFLGNLADASGGGIFNQNSTPSLNNVNFLGNSGQNDGGGIYNNSSSPSLNNVTFSGNRSQNGGGMTNYSSSPSLSNVIFSENNARFGGGMKNNNFSSPNLNNVTFSGNSVADDGGGMHNNGSSPSLKNCLFWGNIKVSSTTTAGADIGNLNSSTTTINNTLLQLASSNYTTGFTLGSGNLFAQNPLFTNTTDPDGADNIFMTADDGLALTVCSPAANVGNNTGVASTDITGNPRIFNTTVDLGAYELQSAALTSPARLYVNVTATGTNTGLTWANAFTSLQSALNYACSSNLTEIWVARGTYKPHASDRNVSFTMKNGVAIYGGFIGTETLLTQRNWTTNPTILSGDLSGNDVVTGSDTTLSITNNAENSYHVIFNNNIGLNNTAILDGFTIKGGNANGSSSTTNAGGGIYNNGSSPNLRNITFTGNSAISGGGIYNFNSSPSLSNVTFSLNSVSDGGGVYNNNSSPSFTNVTFSGNRASQQGGGMSNYSNSSPSLSTVTFSRNSAAADGGGMYNINSTISLSNVLFIGNKASFYGGGMDNNASSLSLNNVAFSGNTAVFGGGMSNYLSSSTSLINVTLSGNKASNNGGGIYNDSSSPNLKNCLFWGNTKAGSTTTVGADIGNFNNTSNSTISNTLMQLTSSNYTTGYTLGSGNLFAQNPLFANAADPDGADNIFMTADDGLALTVCSPAANVGNNTGVASTDITGSPRIFNTTVDLGAYELQSAAFTAAPRLYVNATATGANTGLTWANAFTSLQSALNYTCSSNLTEIWVAKGTYKPHASDRSISFTMKNGVAIYGGFVGTETLLTQRNWTTNPTILSGDLSGNDVITGTGATLSITNNAENSFYVFYNNSNALNNTAILDGFTISGGNANSATLPNYGGGMYNNNSSPNLRNVIFSANSAGIGGGGMFNNASSPTLSNIIFSGNTATNYGGGMDNESTSVPSLTNVTFIGNKANFGGGIDNYFSSPSLSNVIFSGNNASNSGGGLDNVNSSPTLNNVTFSGNSATNQGGGIRNQSSSPTLNNVTFSGNSATNQGGGIYNSSSSPILKNSVFWGNNKANNATSVGADIENVSSGTTTLNYTLLQLASSNYTTGFTLGSGNLFTQNPLFVNASDPDGADNIFMTSDDGLALTACSPAINAGDNTNVTSTDITGNPRIFNATVDLGAYENQLASSGRPIPNPTSNSPKCIGTTLTFNSVAGMSTYSWSGPNSFSSSLQNPSISNVTSLAQGTYSLTVTNASGCTANATTVVIIHPASLNLQSPTNDYGGGTIIQKASNYINANNKINSPANVTYQSGNSINLAPGFEAKIGGVFKAEIGGCAN